MLDVIGIGSLNTDFITTRERLLGLDPKLVAEFQHRFEAGTERKVDESEVLNILSRMGTSAFDDFLGGSAFNTIHTLAALDAGFNLGFVGVAGKTGDDRLDFLRWFASHHVDFKFGRREDKRLSGTCISFIQDGERSLLTCPGANGKMAQHLSRHYTKILGFMSRARILHVTSFFDSETPAVLSRILRDAKRKNPLLILSFDPGYEWLHELSVPVRDILSISDIVFLNESEFKLLGHNHPSDDDRSVAQRVVAACGSDLAIVLLKQVDKISAYRRVRGRVIFQSYRNVVLTPDEIVDATGAGDVFAGGFLACLLIPGLEIGEGVELGLRLVRRKLVQAGSTGFPSFPGLFNRYLDELTGE